MPPSPNGFQLSRAALVIVAVMFVVSISAVLLAPKLHSDVLPGRVFLTFGLSFMGFYGALLAAPYLSIWEPTGELEQDDDVAEAHAPCEEKPAGSPADQA